MFKIRTDKKIQDEKELSGKLVDCLKLILSDVNKQLLPVSECDGSKPMMISTKPKGDFFLELPFPHKKVYLTLDYSDEKVSLLVFKYFLNEIYNSIRPYVSNLHFVDYILAETKNFEEGMIQAAIDNIEEDIENAYGVDFSVINHVSLMQYEGEGNSGHIFFGRVVAQDIKKCSVILSGKRFKANPEEPLSSSQIRHAKFEIKNSKYIRKLMAGAGNDKFGLAFNWKKGAPALECCGYVDVVKARKIFPIEVIIKKNLQYALYINGMCVYNKGVEKYTVKEDDGIDSVVDAVKELSPNQMKCENKIREILTELKSQQHGTSAIFISDMKSTAAKRLSCLESTGRALPVSKVEVKNLKYLSRMDGAIVIRVLKNTCNILLINVILDGVCASEGEPARGARYNAVLNFVKGLNAENKTEVIGAVLSTDENKFDVIK